LIFKYQS